MEFVYKHGEPFGKNLDPNLLTSEFFFSRNCFLSLNEASSLTRKRFFFETLHPLFCCRELVQQRRSPEQPSGCSGFSILKMLKIELPYGTSNLFLKHLPGFSAHGTCFFEKFRFQLCDPMFFIIFHRISAKIPPP